MARFPTAGHLCSWAKFSPGINSSAGKTKGNGSTGHGNRYLARVLGEAAVVASRTDTYLGERYRRIARRRGKKRAVVAVGRCILVIFWHLLADEDTHFTDLGADHFTKHTNPEVKKRNHMLAVAEDADDVVVVVADDAGLSASARSTTRPTQPGSCARYPAPAASAHPRSSDDSATQHDSPTWPRSAPSPGWSRPPTPPAKPTATAERPRPAIPACVRPCSSPPTTPARSTPPWPSATSGSCSPVSTTIPRSARWPRSCSPESPPVCAPAPTTYCATLTAASSPKPKDAPSSPNATPCHPR